MGASTVGGAIVHRAGDGARPGALWRVLWRGLLSGCLSVDLSAVGGMSGLWARPGADVGRGYGVICSYIGKKYECLC